MTAPVCEVWEIEPGLTLSRDVYNGYIVQVYGVPVGWLHASVGGWNAVLQTPGEPSAELGKFPRADAVRMIARNAHVQSAPVPAVLPV